MNQQEGVTEHTGFPNPATDKTLVNLDITRLLIKHPSSTFFMKVEGHRWEQFGIYNDDIATIDRALSPQPNDIVVWWDETDFRMAKYKNLPTHETVWGTICNVIHRYRV